MARYIYDELKEELTTEGYPVVPALLFNFMARVCQENYKCKAPGEIPEEKYDEFKQKVHKQYIDRMEFELNKMVAFGRYYPEFKERLKNYSKKIREKKAKG